MENKKKPFILFGKPVIGEEEIQAVAKVLRSGWIGMGPKCLEFEKQFAEYVGSKRAISLSSCTAALHLALVASGIGPGDEVITTPLTFVATLNAIEYSGAKPVLVDIEEKTLNINPDLIRRAITKDTKAIMPVHFGGLVSDMEKLFSLAREYNLTVIEDAAHAVGSRKEGKMVGGFGRSLACFSFYPNKNITSIEGGMITTEDDEVANKIELMRVHGLSNEAWKRYQAGSSLNHSIAIAQGFKYNMTDVQAAVGICQLRKLEGFLKKREIYAAMYDGILFGLPILIQPRPKDVDKNRHSLHLYLVVLDLNKLDVDRDYLVREIREKGVGATVHYQAVHLHPYYSKKIGPKGLFPVAESISERILTLPLTPGLSLGEAQRVATITRKIILSHVKI